MFKFRIGTKDGAISFRTSKTSQKNCQNCCLNILKYLSMIDQLFNVILINDFKQWKTSLWQFLNRILEQGQSKRAPSEGFSCQSRSSGDHNWLTTACCTFLWNKGFQFKTNFNQPASMKKLDRKAPVNVTEPICPTIWQYTPYHYFNRFNKFKSFPVFTCWSAPSSPDVLVAT